MTDDLSEHSDAEQNAEPPLDDALSEMLQNPAVWEDTNQGTEDAIFAAIFAEAGPDSGPLSIVEDDPVEDPGVSGAARSAGADEHGLRADGNVTSIQSRRWIAPFVAGIAACVVLFAGVGLVSSLRGASDDSAEVALAGTDLAPDASASAEVSATPLGTRIILDVSGLPPAEPGTYYEAWLRTGPEEGVSAGTFHLRGGDGEIELWSGVALADYPLITVTIQPEGDPMSSGVVVLAGRLVGS